MVLLITIITALACSLIGNFLVLRRLSLIGDAISHAILPGLIVAFFMVGTLDSPLFFGLSVIFALLMTVLIQFLVDKIKVSQESIIGIVFTAFFALGVLLLVQFAENVHLDQDAVLYGQVEFSAISHLKVFGIDLGPRSLITMSFVFLLNLLLISLFYKEFKMISFDPGLAKSLGFSTKRMHYLMMALTSITVVAAFEAVGAILVVALLVVPAMTAYLVSKRLSVMIFISAFFATLSAVFGYFLAVYFDGSIAGSVAAISGVFLFLVFFARRLILAV